MRYPKALLKLVKRYVKGTASKKETEFLETYYQQFDKNEGFLSQVTPEMQSQMEEESFIAIKSKIIAPNSSLLINRPYRYVAAAAAVLIAFGGVFIYFSKKDRQQLINPIVNVKGKLDVLPGVQQATLTLADGSKVLLGDKKNEAILNTNGLNVSLNGQGELIYKVNSNSGANQSKFHTLETAKGNQFQIVLADGTKVWLNAMSSLHFPEAFGQTRTVELNGEGYFEVAKDAQHPFIVKTQVGGITQKVQVLGTTFNINGYLDEPVLKTTLLEGSVKIEHQNTFTLLKPNFQARLNAQQLVLKQVDPEAEVAWKNGLFSFENASLKNILSQISRWYNVDISQTEIPNKRFNGVISRNVNLSEVLHMLAVTGNVNIKLNANRTLSIVEN